MKRRDFLKKVALAVGATAIPLEDLDALLILDPERELTDHYAAEVASSLDPQELQKAYLLLCETPMLPNYLFMSQECYDYLKRRQ